MTKAVFIAVAWLVGKYEVTVLLKMLFRKNLDHQYYKDSLFSIGPME